MVTEARPDGAGSTWEGEPGGTLARPEQSLEIELVLETHRVRGTLRHPGNPRRLVDVLNSIEGGYLVVHSGRLQTAGADGEFESAQIARDAVLYAAPRSEVALPPDRMEAVRKVPVPSRILLPGYEIRGNTYFLPDADVKNMPVLANRHFLPVTDATVSGREDGSESKEPLVVINLARALLFSAG